MAARAGIRFSTRGAGQTIGKVKGVGAAFGGLGKSSKSASFGLGRVAYRLYNTLARISMVRRGVTGMSREVKGAENKWRGWGRAMGGPFTSVLAGVSKRFAEVRRTIAFYILAVKDYVKWGKKMTGIQKATSKGVPSKRVGKAAEGAPPVKPPPAGIVGAFGKLGGAYRIAATAAKILTGAVIGLTVALTALYTYIGYKTAKMALGVVKGFMSIRETFRKYEISLGGIVRSTAATAKIMKFAVKYAEEYPAMFEDVIDAFRGLASMPTLKPLFRKADYDDLKGIMDVVQGLATLKPQQGVQGAMMALREALSGQMRSLRMRFEVNVREMADAAGFSFGEITHDANKALIAIRKFVELNVPAEAMASMAKTIEVQWGNVYDKYRTFVNEMMKSTGAYWAVVKALERLNEWFEKVFAAPEIVSFAQKVGNVLREIVGIFEEAMTGFDWRGYLERGDIVGAVRDLCDRIKTLFTVLWEEFGEEAKEVLKTVAALLKEVLKPAFNMIVASFWEMMKAGAADAGRITGKLFGIAFKGTATALIGGAWKKLTTLERPLLDWGQKPKAEVPEIKKPKPIFYKISREKREEGAERFAVATDPLKQAALLAERLKRKAKAIREKALISKPEPVKTGEDVPLEIDKKALENLKKQEEIKKALYYAEKKIYRAKLLGGKNAQQLVDWEIQLVNLVIEQFKAEEELVEIGERRKNNEKDIAELKMHGYQQLTKIAELEKSLVTLAQQKIQAEKQMALAGSDQRKVKEQILELEAQISKTQEKIAEIREGNIRGINNLIKLEKESIDLSQEKLDAEQKIAQAAQKQITLKKKILDIDKKITKKKKEEKKKEEKKKEEKEEKRVTITFYDKALWGLKKLDKATSHFLQFFQEGMEKGAAALAGLKVPGMGAMTWGEAAKKSTRKETAGIPKFFLKQEDILKEKLGRAIAPAAKKGILEKLYELNVAQFKMATTPGAKAMQFMEANKIMGLLLDAEVDYHRQTMEYRRSQLNLIGKSNQLLEAISVGVGTAFKGSPFNISKADWGNKKISETNPETTPAAII